MGDLTRVQDIGPLNHWLAIVSATRPDGSVHSSLVNAGILEHPTNRGEFVVGLVVSGATKKLDHIRRAGCATVAFQHGWQWVAVDGPADVIGPDDRRIIAPADVPELLRAVFRAAGGTHDDWAEYDRVMAEQRRAAVLVHPLRVISNAPG